jgi:hypothetical protein
MTIKAASGVLAITLVKTSGPWHIATNKPASNRKYKAGKKRSTLRAIRI